MYHLDARTFGNPEYSLSQTQSEQFIRGSVNDLGRGHYRNMNPTSPLPCSIRFRWTSQQFSAFRIAWNSATDINYGANWFTMDLPLMLDNSEDADPFLYPKTVTVIDPISGASTQKAHFQKYRIHAEGPFSSSLITHQLWMVSLNILVDQTPLPNMVQEFSIQSESFGDSNVEV